MWLLKDTCQWKTDKYNFYRHEFYNAKCIFFFNHYQIVRFVITVENLISFLICSEEIFLFF